MGWGSGSQVMSDIIGALKNELDEPTRVKVYVKIIRALQDHDWDTEEECCGDDPAYDEALKIVMPHWYSDNWN